MTHFNFLLNLSGELNNQNKINKQQQQQKKRKRKKKKKREETK
jgi:hypothetical protein